MINWIWFHYSFRCQIRIQFFVSHHKMWIYLSLVIIHLVEYDKFTKLPSLKMNTFFNWELRIKRLAIELLFTTSSKHMNSLIPLTKYNRDEMVRFACYTLHIVKYLQAASYKQQSTNWNGSYYFQLDLWHIHSYVSCIGIALINLFDLSDDDLHFSMLSTQRTIE